MAIHTSAPRRVVVGITGASGAVLGVQLLRQLRELPQVESHLVVTDAGWLTLRHEMNMSQQQVAALAHQHYACSEVGAAIASGSFACSGMVIAPCSMRTLASVAHGMADNLLTRAADVALKERRRLVLLVREAPFNLAHLRNMVAVTEIGRHRFSARARLLPATAIAGRSHPPHRAAGAEPAGHCPRTCQQPVAGLACCGERAIDSRQTIT